MHTRFAGFFWLIPAVLLTTELAMAADTPTVELALQFRPVQADLEYETPTAAEYKQCQVKVEREGKTSGWVVLGPAGQILRRFIDTNADNVVDQWRYFNHGLEVYRDIDGDFNNKVDQSRWLNTAGSRWGIDKNEDGKIDSWKSLSAEEATRVAVNSLVAGDSQSLQHVLISQQDLKDLKVADTVAKELLQAVDDPAKQMRAILSNSKSIKQQSRWLRFNAAMPSLIPADAGKAANDLLVYENVIAFIETDNNSHLVQIGEMLRVGDVWKLTQIPKPLEGDSQVTEGGLLMQPTFASVGNPAATPTTSTSPAVQKLLEELQDLDRNSPAANAGRNSLVKYNSARIALLSKLIQASSTNEERHQWVRQMVDGLTSSVQTAGYKEGLAQLKSIENDVRRSAPKDDIVPYVEYRRLLAEYTLGIQVADNDAREKAQKDWLEGLQAFVKSWPRAEDTSEAIQHLAISQEFAGNLADAKKWYGELIDQHGDTPAGIRASGAMRRLDLQGKPFTFAGSGLEGGTVDVGRLRGKLVLVLFWATWCQPCTEDLPQIRAMYEQYHAQGFEIVGVNLDSTVDPIGAYLKQHRVTWPQIYEPGGLESDPAKAFGIISLPTMFLVGKDGTVINRSISAEQLKEDLPELINPKKN